MIPFLFAGRLALVALLIALVPTLAFAQGGPPAPEPVDQPNEVAELRDKYENLSAEEVEEAGFEIPDECVSVPDLGGMGYHTINGRLMGEQFPAGEMDPNDPPILLLDKDHKVRGVEWEAKDIGQGELDLYGQAVELQPGHPGVEEPHYMMHVYFRPDNQVLMLSSATAPPFDPTVECPAGMPETGAGGLADRGQSVPSTPLAALAAGGLILAGAAWMSGRRAA